MAESEVALSIPPVPGSPAPDAPLSFSPLSFSPLSFDEEVPAPPERATAVPEPSSLVLVVGGLAGALMRRRRMVAVARS